MKPRVYFLPRRGDSDEAVVRFFAKDGAPTVERLLRTSHCLSIVEPGGPQEQMKRLIDRCMQRYAQEQKLGYWPV